MGITLTIVEAQKFLDGLIEDNERYNTDRHLNNQIYAVKHPKIIQIGEGIEILADVLPVKLDVTDPDVPYFYYKDYLVYQVKEREKDD